MIKIPVPRPGFSLVDLCRLCAEHAITMHIGVAGVHVGLTPATITLQFTSAKQDDPEAFAVELRTDNPHLNLGMSKLVADYMERVSMKPRIHLVN